MKKLLLSILTLVIFASLLVCYSVSVGAASTDFGSVTAASNGFSKDKENYVFNYVSFGLKDTDGNAVDTKNVISGGYLYTKAAIIGNNLLKSEPVIGTTYYSNITIDLNSTGRGWDIDPEDVSITIAGFEVGNINFMEREMGSYLSISFSARYVRETITTGTTLSVNGEKRVEFVAAGTGIYPFESIGSDSSDPSAAIYDADGNLLYSADAEKNGEFKILARLYEGRKYTLSVTTTNPCQIKLTRCYHASSTGEPNFTNEATCVSCGVKRPIIFGEVQMHDGDYLHSESTVLTPEKPEGGYAYYKDGTLTLNNFTYNGLGYRNYGIYAVVYTKGISLKVNLIGDNAFLPTRSVSGFSANNANLVFGGSGSLTLKTDIYSFSAEYGDITFNSGTYNVLAEQTALSVYYGTLYVKGGNINVTSNKTGFTVANRLGIIISGGRININSKDSIAIQSNIGVTISGGSLNLTSKHECIQSTNKDITISGGKIVASSEGSAIVCEKAILINGGNLSLTSTATENDANYSAIRSTSGKITVSDKVTLKGATEPSGTPGSVNLSKIDDYDRIEIELKLIDSATLFSDLKKNWAKEGIDYVVTYGYMSGVSNNKFNQSGTMTRAMLVSVLWRIAGQPEPTIQNPFTDLEKKQTWYHKAVIWAYENEVVAGTSATTFAPTQPVNREQMASFLFRFAKYFGIDVTKTTDISSFPDAKDVSSWAKEAMAWANAEGLISGAKGGDGLTRLSPKGNATREQVASILMRFCKEFDIC